MPYKNRTILEYARPLDWAELCCAKVCI